MALMRLNKFLSEAGITSRRNADNLIKEGRIQVNNKIVTELGFKIDPNKDKVYFDGELIKPPKFVYYIFHKPAGYITTLKDEKKRKTIFDLIKLPYRVFPVGRLDRDTTGVLLLTNDGDFANFLTHPKNKILREYIATLDKPLPETLIKSLKIINLSDGPVKIDSVAYADKSKKKIQIALREGRNRIVKRIFAKLGFQVKALHRISYAGFRVNNIPLGKLVQIPESEIKKVYSKHE